MKKSKVTLFKLNNDRIKQTQQTFVEKKTDNLDFVIGDFEAKHKSEKIIADYSLEKKRTTYETILNLHSTLNKSKNKNERKANGFTNLAKTMNLSSNMKLFFDKLQYNVSNREPVDFNPYQLSNNELTGFSFFNFPERIQQVIKTFKIIYLLMFLFLLPLSFNYSIVRQSGAFVVMTVFGIVIALADLKQYFKVNQDNDKMRGLAINSHENSKSKVIFLEFLIVVSQIFALAFDQYLPSPYLHLFMVFKVFKYTDILGELELEFFQEFRYRKYWDLFKVFFINLLICHFLANILIGVASNSDQSWMTERNLKSKEWAHQYIWSYYFGVSMILTVGFGDFHATNEKQALVIIFVCMFACIYFGYNINYIGNLISMIKEQEIEKNQRLRVLNNLAKKEKISGAIKTQLANYITEESKIKHDFNHQEAKKLLQQMPADLRSSFLRESNQRLFNQLKKIMTFTNKTIQDMSLTIEAKICHPGQYIKRLKNDPQLIILRSGEVGLTTKRKGSDFNNIVVQKITSDLDQESKLLCLDLPLKQTNNYEIRALNYSIIYSMSIETFEKILKNSIEDHQIYREIIDKCKYKLNGLNTIKCMFCPRGVHTLFECPKLHFTPFRSLVSFKNRDKSRNEKQNRVKFYRHKILFSSRNQQLNCLQEKCCSETDLMMRSSKGFFTKKEKIDSRKRRSTIEDIEQNLMKMLKNQLESFKIPSQESFQFNFWNLECDEPFDFKFYFPKFNPSNLENLLPKNRNSSQSKIKRKIHRNKKKYNAVL